METAPRDACSRAISVAQRSPLGRASRCTSAAQWRETMTKLLATAAILGALVAPASAYNDVDQGVAGVLVYGAKCDESAIPTNAKRFIVIYNKTRGLHVQEAAKALYSTIAKAAGGDLDTGMNLWCSIMENKVGPIFDNMSRIDF